MCYVCPSWTVSFLAHFASLWYGDSPHLDIRFKMITFLFLFIYLCLECKHKTPLASPLWVVVVLVFGLCPVFISTVPPLSQGYIGIICMAYFLHGVWWISTSRHLSSNISLGLDTSGQTSMSWSTSYLISRFTLRSYSQVKLSNFIFVPH